MVALTPTPFPPPAAMVTDQRAADRWSTKAFTFGGTRAPAA
jgi:hypothetical protein